MTHYDTSNLTGSLTWGQEVTLECHSYAAVVALSSNRADQSSPRPQIRDAKTRSTALSYTNFTRTGLHSRIYICWR